MKNQYYGDINDYKKYAYLRYLVKNGDFSLGINWYLTEDDDSSDGGKTNYLQSSSKWKHLDAELFSRLHQSVKVRQSRTVSNAPHDLALGSKVTFFADYTPHVIAERELWLLRAEDALMNSNMIFLDPDNGMAVTSVPMGHKRCSKYAFDNEIKRFSSGSNERSIIVYQHFPRKEREAFMDECSQRVSTLLKRRSVIRIRTSNVLFIVVPSEEHRTAVEKLTYAFGSIWGRYISVSVWQTNR